MKNRNPARQRRSRATRLKIRELQVARLTVRRSNSHIYAQVIDPSNTRVLAAASTAEAQMRKDLKTGGNVAAAAVVGRCIAERAKSAGIEAVAFDRAGYRYHGRVKALAEAAREAGLKF
jgi:large subunit ribosomal protein L18